MQTGYLSRNFILQVHESVTFMEDFNISCVEVDILAAGDIRGNSSFGDHKHSKIPRHVPE